MRNVFAGVALRLRANTLAGGAAGGWRGFDPMRRDRRRHAFRTGAAIIRADLHKSIIDVCHCHSDVMRDFYCTDTCVT